MAFTDAERAYLSTQRLARIGTSASDGTADVAPVGFVVAGSDLLIGGLDITKTRKYRNILATGNAAVVIDDLASVDPWKPRGVKIQGPAIIEAAGNGKPRIRVSAATVWSWGINEHGEAVFANIERRTIEESS